MLFYLNTSLAVSSREPKPDDDDFNVLPVIYTSAPA